MKVIILIILFLTNLVSIIERKVFVETKVCAVENSLAIKEEKNESKK